MTPQDWRDLARVMRAGSRMAATYGADERARWILNEMAGECDAIAQKREQPKETQISCKVCRQLKPGPGFILRDNRGVIRVCDDCNSQHGISEMLRLGRRQ